MSCNASAVAFVYTEAVQLIPVKVLLGMYAREVGFLGLYACPCEYEGDEI